MGYNTSVIVLNDALRDIENDPQFGKKLSRAVSSINTERYIRHKANRPFYGVDVSAGCHCNAATVIETHHADSTSVVSFGQNSGTLLIEHLYAYGEESREEKILKELARKLGYEVVKKPQK